MSAPCETALANPPSHVSRYSGRPVATRADGMPVWFNRASPSSTEAQPRVIEAGAGKGIKR